MSACCIFVAFVIFILFSPLNNPMLNTQRVAFGDIGGYEVDVLCNLMDKTSIR